MFETIILSNLVNNEPFTRKVIPYIIKEYFESKPHQIVFDLSFDYINKYNMLPSKEALKIALAETNVKEDEGEQCDTLIDELRVDPKTGMEWLMHESEKWCQKRAVYLALVKSLKIHDDNAMGVGKEELGTIPKIMTDALGVSFDNSIGNDFFIDADDRWDFYHLDRNKVKFGIEAFNNLTAGGLSVKTLTIFLAGTNVGKTAFMSHLAADNLRDGKKVLYISAEMGEEEIQKRIEANLLDLTVAEIVKDLSKDQYLRKIAAIRRLTGGELKVKEYPTGQASAANFRFLLNELKLKSNFIPDIIYVDYMNICKSAALHGSRAPKDQQVISISEELRGLAVEKEVPVVTASQFNREGFKSSDPGMGDIAQAFGTAWTADEIFAINRSEEMDRVGQLAFTHLKTRSSDKGIVRFVVGVDMKRFKFYDVADTEQTLVGQEEFLADMQKERDKFDDIFG